MLRYFLRFTPSHYAAYRRHAFDFAATALLQSPARFSRRFRELCCRLIFHIDATAAARPLWRAISDFTSSHFASVAYFR